MTDDPTTRTITVERDSELTFEVYTKYSDDKIVTRGRRIAAIIDRAGIRHHVHYPTSSADFEEIVPGISTKFDRSVTHAGSTTFIETKVTVRVAGSACPVGLVPEEAGEAL